MKYLVVGALMAGALLAQEVRYETLEMRGHWEPPEVHLVQIKAKSAGRHHKAKPNAVKHDTKSAKPAHQPRFA